MNQLRERILEKAAHLPQVTVAVAYKNLSNGELLLINELEMMHAASTMKVPVMFEVFKQAEMGKFQMSNSILVKNKFKSIIDGSSYAMDIGENSDESIYDQIGTKMSIYDLTVQMITVSSNLATNILIELVEAANVMQTMKEINANKIQVLRGVEDIKAYRAGKNNITNAYDLMRILDAIARQRVVSREACEQMVKIMSQQEFRDKIPRLLPESVRIANKTGSITKIDHDCAIVYPPISSAYVLVVLTKGIEDKKAARNLIAEISKITYEAQHQGRFA